MPQIYAGMWVRNGIQIKGQAMTYIQCHFCYSMADLDIFLLQVSLMSFNSACSFICVFAHQFPTTTTTYGSCCTSVCC
jgi:hypothetical protein